MKTALKAFSGGIFRLCAGGDGGLYEGLMSRYGLVHEPKAVDCGEQSVSDGVRTLCADGNVFSLKGGKRDVTLNVEGINGYNNAGFTLNIPIVEGERFFGLGDENRDMIEKRGHKATMWVANNTAYGPMPFLMSSEGWAIFVNSTFPHTFDIGKTNPDLLTIEAREGSLDVYLFCGESMKELLGLYTDLTGKPMLMPKFAFGYLFVCNEQTDARALLWDCRTFRKEGLLCDTMGLEPSWMSKHYDYSTEKSWNKDLFYLPHWNPDNQSGDFTFFFALRQMGFRFSLWLCQDYDLLWKEEGDAAKLEEHSADYENAEIVDDHFAHGVKMDKITKIGEDWFEHLKKFVDNGASAFKLDGSNQVIEHPDRLWAGKYRDSEVHNIYPVLYARQMQEGFEDYTNRRAMIYTAGMYTGTQQYAATWAGDTGGGPRTLVSVLNFAMSGHSNTTCDMKVTAKEGIHYGFLMPWTQHLGWANWQYPWFLKEELEETMKEYGRLRSSLFPYLYTTAHNAFETGVPMARPMPLEFEGETRFDKALNEYMLGDSLLVGAFDMNLTLPKGLWIDFWTEQEYAGGGTLQYEIPAGKGGALLVKGGAVFARMESQRSIEEKIPETLTVEWYPREGAKGAFTLWEDDGESLRYREGIGAKTKMTASTENRVATLNIAPRQVNDDGDTKYLAKFLKLRIHTPICPASVKDGEGRELKVVGENGVWNVELPGAFCKGFEVKAEI